MFGKASLWAGLVALVLLATGGGVSYFTVSSPPAHYTLRVLASSDLRDMTKILAQAAARTGVSVQMTTTSPVNAAQEIENGTARRHYDAVWFPSDDYFDLLPAAEKNLTGSTAIMASPVVLAVRSSAARRLGWEKGSATWAAIASAAASGQFTFGMASPASADAGLSGLVAATIATARAGGQLLESQISGAVPELTDLFHGQVLSAPDSASLLGDYLNDLRHPGPQLPDGIIDHEADLITLKAEAPPSDPLTLVYPSNGVIESDYPLSALSTASPAAMDAFKRLVDYLVSPTVQRQIVTTTHRRPVVPLAQPGGQLPAILDTVQSPGNAATLRALIDAYLDRLRTPGRTVYVLDTSASMAEDQGLTDLKHALSALTGVDGTLTGEFTEFRTGEDVTFLPFNYGPGTPTSFSVPDSDPGPELALMRGYINGLTAHGETDMYDALLRADQILAQQGAKSPSRIDSIVLITDGVSYVGPGQGYYLSHYRSVSPGGAPVPVYSIAVGAANPDELKTVSRDTGGAFFDARREPLSGLEAFFRDIRGYE